MRKAQRLKFAQFLSGLVILLVLGGLAEFTHHVTHCDQPGGDCNICKLASSVVPAAAETTAHLQYSCSEIIFDHSGIVGDSIAVHPRSVRAPPVFLPSV